MFDGYRPTSSFVLLLAISAIASMMAARAGRRFGYPGFICIIVLLSFSRADIALLYSVVGAGCLRNSILEKLLIVAIPLAAQLLLSEIIFPDAEYFTAVVMLATNLSGDFLVRSPVLYLVFGALLVYWPIMKQIVVHTFQHQKVAFLAVGGYLFALMIVAMPNEFRLFLPLVPLYLWLWEDFKTMHQSPARSG